MINKLDQSGLDFISENEGIILHPYLDSKNIPTIGIGCTYYPGGAKVTMQDPPITKEQAYELFSATSRDFCNAVASCNQSLTQNQFNALFSFCYNIGIHGFENSTAYRRIEANPNDPTIPDAMLLWNKPPEIIGRRKREAELYALDNSE